MHRRWIPFALAAVLMLSAAGCGGAQSDPSAGHAKEASAERSSAPVKAKPELKGKIRIGFVGLNDQTAPDPLTGDTVYGADELKKWLKQDYPNIDFEVVTYPFKDHQGKVKALIESRQIDVAVESDSKFLWNQGFSQELTPWLEKDKEWSKDHYLSSSMFTGPLEVDPYGRSVINALPIAVDASGIFFDKSIFEAYGIPPLSSNPTWDEVLEKAKRLTGKNPKTGELTYGLFTRIPSDNAGYNVSIIANTFGADMGQMGYKEYLNQVSLNSPGMVQATNYFKSLIPYMPPGTVQGLGGEKWSTPRNNIAMYINLPAIQLQKFRSLKMDDRYDVAMIPKGPGGTGGFLGGMRVQMVKNAQDKELAWEIVKWMSVGNGQRFLWETKWMMPVSVKALGPNYMPDALEEKMFKMVEQAQYMSPIWFTTAKFALTRAMEKVLLKDTPAQEALDQAQGEVEQEFAKMKAADQKK
ncbi:ABC transporter substrate-binding protein [Paenibacillus cremeus]|uniref:Extracellular solute-binding protein n=1 Tax=Paenibacillus cremeus TaxID=2163881 RepID=A0A559KG59_9BACL|nr:extracellular solute-binding protein [Paenibacillus cremeus]TVY11113.1 extracellular solute-binding protein [Paenibacillus cremeus]